MDIHRGNYFLGGNEGGRLLIHTDHAERNYQQGYLEEEMLHECAHTFYLSDSFLLDGLAPQGWYDAVAADDGNFISRYAENYPGREDFAETLIGWIATRYSEISSTHRELIEATIPNRLTYIDRMNLDMRPFASAAIPFRDDTIIPPSEGSFYIYSKATNKGISLASPENLANVNLSSEPTKFFFRDGHIVAEGLDLSLHVARTSRLDNTTVVAYLEGNWWASSFSFIEVEHAFYKIVTFTGEKVVEASGTQEGANIRQGAFRNAPTQLWRLERADTLECEALPSGDNFRIVSAVDGNFLDVEGRNVITSLAPGSDALWNFDGNEVVSSQSNKSLNIASANRENSANVIVWDQGNYVNSQWCFVYLGEGNYKIISRYSGKALTAHQNNSSGKRNVLMWDYVGVDRQQWKVLF